MPRLLFAALALSVLAACTVSDDDGGGGDQSGTMDGGGGSGIDASLGCGTADPLLFMCPCSLADDRCDRAAGDTCYDFNAKGPHCTHECSGSGDCPSPSGGCNMMGVCKAPD